VLQRIFIEPQGAQLTMVATDGRRLALVDEDVDVGDKSQTGIHCARQTVNELNRLLTDKGDVEVRYAGNQAAFTLKDEKGMNIVIVTQAD